MSMICSSQSALESFRFRWPLISLLGVHISLLAWSGYCHSPSQNEIGHLPAGIAIWQYGRFDLYRVNPPLVKLLAAAPVCVWQPDITLNNYDSSPELRPEVWIGQRFTESNGNRSFWFFTLARWACIPLSILGGWCCFQWARLLYGERAGLLALTLWCFSPNVLAHASMITPDAGAAALGITATYAYWRWLQKSSWKRSLVAGALLELAGLTKFTWLVLFPLWPLLWLFWSFSTKDNTSQRRLSRTWPQLATILLTALYVINVGYAFEGSCTRLGDFEFVSASLSGGDVLADPNETRNYFRGSWLGAVPVPVPADFIVGIDQQMRDFDRGKPSYLLGEHSDRGWWYYYLVALAFKVPLGTWVLAILSIWGFWRFRPGGARLRDQVVLLAPAITVFVIVSSETGFSRHMRYVLPAFPFAFVWVSQVAASVGRCRWLYSVVVLSAVAWSVISSLSVYPHSLSYFNEFAGGPLGGPKVLLDSNID